jgi:hypothetical protein
MEYRWGVIMCLMSAQGILAASGVAGVAVVAGVIGLIFLFADLDKAGTAQVNADCIRTLDGFAEYPVVYPGETVFGLPLTMCQRYRTPAFYDSQGRLVTPATDSLALIYGTCQPGPDAGCPPPVQIIIEPPCGPGTLHDSQKVETVRVRGVDAFVKPDGSVRIETDQFRVSVFALVGPSGVKDSQRENALRIVELLRGGNPLAKAVGPDTSLSVRLGNEQPCG